MKVILISKCSECPYCYNHYTDPIRSECLRRAKTSKDRNDPHVFNAPEIKDRDVIDNGCPLKDINEIKHLKDEEEKKREDY